MTFLSELKWPCLTLKVFSLIPKKGGNHVFRIITSRDVRAALQWLLEEVQDELKDRQDSPGKFAHH